MLEHAIKYGKLGWKVFPVIGKKPAIIGWQEKATSDPVEIKKLFQVKHTGIGLACGKESGVTVLDVDNNNGHNGFETMKRMGVELPLTVCSNTPNGGKHYFFKYNSQLKNMVSAIHKDSGLDIRNDGGYVVLPPSKSESDVIYEFLEEQTPGLLWN